MLAPLDAAAPVAEAVLDATTNGAETVKLVTEDDAADDDEAEVDEAAEELVDEELGATHCEEDEVLASGVHVEEGGVYVDVGVQLVVGAT